MNPYDGTDHGLYLEPEIEHDNAYFSFTPSRDTTVNAFPALTDEFKSFYQKEDTTKDHAYPGNNETVQAKGTEDALKEKLRRAHPERVYVKRINILKVIVNSLNGKDKVAKILKYVFDLLNFGLTKLTQSNKLLDRIFANKTLSRFLRQPRLLMTYMSKKLVAKLSFISSQLSTYRYILRFGSSPFLLLDLIEKCKQKWKVEKAKNLDTFSTVLSFAVSYPNEKSVRELNDLYFTFCDEMMLLHKFKVWSSLTLATTLMRHEVYAWQFDIVVNLKDTISKWNGIKRRELETNIEMEILSRPGTSNPHYNESDFIPGQPSEKHRESNKNEELQILRDRLLILKEEKQTTQLDLIRLMFDCAANSTDLFNLNISSGTYSILSLFSGISGFIKLWIQAEKQLIEEQLT
ncbi:uncharacterized protein KNAG_0A03380 [Huiozyma naganishii CBS 8797]|uniref:Pex25p n=1 Tax=Huiozyma naganishii (strain ATCC MYA-139 / BCRC 22969 / CBS 8797 / KCTC 17520 / NBRC 10181 / NCYC 3082 / Yp74L-3) TaxID=1071383 RepID=J7RTH3_HUIN7|nr:hypothetical protein KNAG_0A03380 [Kazachstania naganishii CBS 8797]CCK68022.1 hypothetical protein KNAG_0A03380 [Kazachstania naganishii CBS 8797]